MLVPLSNVLDSACREHRCILAFNIYNFETARSVLNASQALDSPVILAYGERYADYIPMDLMSLVVKKLAESYSMPIVYHLDHAHDLARIESAVAAGFTSVMFDGSKLPFKENLKTTKKVTKLAHSAGVSVEAELGYVATADETDLTGSALVHHYTDPVEARTFVADTNVDALAISIGNVHGLRTGMNTSVRLDFALLRRIREACEIPLVLHGGSGVPEEDLRRAIGLGICKLNVNTELSTGAVDEIRNSLREGGRGLRFEDLMTDVSGAMERIAAHYISSFSKAKVDD